MNWHRISVLIFRIIKQFVRDKRTLALIFLVPALVLSLMAYVIGAEISEVKIALVNQDKGLGKPQFSAGKIVERLLEGEDDFETTNTSLEEAEELLRAGKVKALVQLPPEFSTGVMAGKGGKINIKLEGSDYVYNGAVISSFNKIRPKIFEELKNMLGNNQPQRVSPGVETEVSYLHGGENLTISDYFGPIYIAFFVFFFVFLLTVVSFIRERSSGTLERIFATPLRRGEIILGYTFGFSLFALVQSLIILLFAAYVLDIHFVGALYQIFIVEALLVGGAVNLGIFLSTFAKSEFQAVQFIPLVLIPQILLSGIFWPVEAMPRFLQVLSALFPLTYANVALRALMIKGLSLTEIAPEIATLFSFGLLALFLSILTLRREVA